MATATEVKVEECEVCGKSKAKYTCPKCEVRTCCIECVNIHKKELECTGIRDKTKFVPLNKFTDLDLLSDYRMLEQIGRVIDKLKADPSKRYTRQRELPPHLFKLRSAAYQRGTFLHLMPQNFTRHKENTTYLNFKTNEISWRIEWIFPQAENLCYISERIIENETISNALNQIWNPVNESNEEIKDFEVLNEKLRLRDKLQYYNAASFPGIRVFLKAEKVENCKSKFYELDVESTFKDNFKKKHIIEFPTIHVVLKDHCNMYEVIDSDEEEVSEKNEEVFEKRRKVLKSKRKFPNNWKSRNNSKPRETQVNYKQEQTNKEKSQTKTESTPCNYFFNADMCESDSEPESCEATKVQFKGGV